MALASIIVIVGGFGPAVAQDDAPGGTTLTFGVESITQRQRQLQSCRCGPRHQHHSGYDAVFWLSVRNRYDRFAFDIDGVVRASDIPGVGSDVRFDDANAALSYTREGANSRLSCDRCL